MTKLVNRSIIELCEVEKGVAPFPLDKPRINLHKKELSRHSRVTGKSGGTASKTRPVHINLFGACRMGLFSYCVIPVKTGIQPLFDAESMVFYFIIKIARVYFIFVTEKQLQLLT